MSKTYRIDRDELLERVMALDVKNLCLTLSTGVGKSKLSIEYICKFKPKSVLFVTPKLVLIQNYEDEIEKWGKAEELRGRITYTTYISLPKYAYKDFDIVILEECHHLSERAYEAFKTITYRHCVGMSATLNRRVKDYLNSMGTTYIDVSQRTAIDNNILPDPKVYLFPLQLDNTKYEYVWKKKAKKGNKMPALKLPYHQKFAYRNYTGEITFQCTARQYYNELSGIITWYKGKSASRVMHTAWLHKCSERLAWLSTIKEPVLLVLRKHCSKHKTLMFCNNIKQSERIGNSVNSKRGLGNLVKFNDGKIKFISSINILAEGVNLVDCKIGIFGNVNSSELLITQKNGRLLRHRHPYIIIPYYQNTREEEIVREMCKNYNPELITTVTSVKDIKIE